MSRFVLQLLSAGWEGLFKADSYSNNHYRGVPAQASAPST